MEVQLLKDLQVGKKGEVKNLPDPIANYLIRCKAAEEVKDGVKEEVIEKKAVKKNGTRGRKASTKH